MKFIWKTQYLKYIIVILLLIVILYFTYNSSFKEGVTSASPQETCGDFTIENNNLMNDLTNKNINATSATLDTQITECITLINEINQYLPMSLNDISVASVTQSEAGNTTPSIEVNIITPKDTQGASVEFASGESSTSGSPSPAG